MMDGTCLSGQWTRSLRRPYGMSSGEASVGLVWLAPELIHKVALSGWLGVKDVSALSQTCKRMAEVLVWDAYAKNIHQALVGVMENVAAERWVPARYAVKRRWFVRGEDEASVWMSVAKAVSGDERMEDVDEKGWESVMLAALSLPGARGCLDTWGHLILAEEGTKTSLLHVAAEMWSERVVDWVVEHGGDVNVRNEFNDTPLLVAGTDGSERMVKKLLEVGADATAKNTISQNLFYVSCSSGNAELVRFAAGLGVFDINEKDSYRSSPLGIASLYGNLSVVKVLVEELGADVDVEGRNPKGPLYWAGVRGHTAVMQVLVDGGAWSGVAKDGGVWVGGLVGGAKSMARDERVDVVRLYLGWGVGVDGVDGDTEMTALCAASREGNADVVRVLLEEGGADVNKAGKNGQTPISWACESRKADVVRVLLDAGADIGIVDDFGRTPLRVALLQAVAWRSGGEGIVELLQDAHRSQSRSQSR